MPSRFDIPEFDGMVIAGADEHLAVWRHGERANPARVAL